MRTLLLFGLIFGIIGCASSGSSEKDEQLKAAAELHQKAIDIDKAVRPGIEALKQQTNDLQKQGRALSEQEIAFTKAVNKLQQRYNFWDKNHVEVPGYEHEHHHDHDGHDHGHHHHDHGPSLELSPADMLIVQQEFLDSIKAIQQTVVALEGYFEGVAADSLQ